MEKLPPGWENQTIEKTKLPLATQLFPVGNQFDKDKRGTLKKIKEADYDGVEFFGNLKYEAHELRFLLDEAGLKMAGWHTPWRYLSPNTIHTTITYNKVLNNQYVIVPWMPDEQLHTRDACLQFAAGLTWVSDVLAQYDMVTGYHNHKTEFRPTDDTKEIPWEIIAENTPSTVVMQNDVGNGMSGGGDMVNLLKKYPGRGTSVHVKPYSKVNKSTFFDDPTCEINWNEYFDICRNIAGVRWYIIEYLDNTKFPNDPMAGLAASAKWFREQEEK